jgi:hypothetical protein
MGETTNNPAQRAPTLTPLEYGKWQSNQVEKTIFRPIIYGRQTVGKQVRHPGGRKENIMFFQTMKELREYNCSILHAEFQRDSQEENPYV